MIRSLTSRTNSYGFAHSARLVPDMVVTVKLVEASGWSTDFVADVGFFFIDLAAALLEAGRFRTMRPEIVSIFAGNAASLDDIARPEKIPRKS